MQKFGHKLQMFGQLYAMGVGIGRLSVHLHHLAMWYISVKNIISEKIQYKKL